MKSALVAVLLGAALFATWANGGSSSVSATGGVRGDANCDGSENSIDASLVLQFHARLLAYLPCSALADVNQDGNLDSVDAFLMIKVTAGVFGPGPSRAKAAILAAIGATAEDMDIPTGQVVLSGIELQTWPDGCLGLGQDKPCTQGLVPGYRITVTGYFGGLPGPTPPAPPGYDFQKHIWRTNLDGSKLRLEAIAVP